MFIKICPLRQFLSFYPVSAELQAHNFSQNSLHGDHIDADDEAEYAQLGKDRLR